MRSHSLVALAATALFGSSSLLGTSVAQAAFPHGPNGWHHHDRGFFMRLSGGPGFGSATLDANSETGFSGVGFQGSFAFGGLVARNLAIHADLFGINMFEPTVTVDGQDQGDAENTTVRLGAIGAGITGYIMPLNLYLSGSIGVGVGTAHTRGQFLGATFDVESDTDPGLSIDLLIGKEWFVSRHWGLGLAVQAMYAALETDDGADFSVFSVGVLFSASMD